MFLKIALGFKGIFEELRHYDRHKRDIVSGTAHTSAHIFLLVDSEVDSVFGKYKIQAGHFVRKHNLSESSSTQHFLPHP